MSLNKRHGTCRKMRDTGRVTIQETGGISLNIKQEMEISLNKRHGGEVKSLFGGNMGSYSCLMMFQRGWL